MANKKILIVNDTSGLSNPGCRAASDVLFNALAVRGEIIDRYPVGYRSEEFKKLPGVRSQCIVEKKGYFNSYDNNVTDVDIEKWETLAHQAYGKDEKLKQAVSYCDEIVINAEGSIHHNFRRAVALLALIHEISKYSKPMVIVNSSIMAMDERILTTAMRGVSFIHVRETLSRQYIRQYCPKLSVYCSPDLAFGANVGTEVSAHQSISKRNGILLTSCALSTLSQIEELLEILYNSGISTTFLSIGDGAESSSLIHACREYGANIINSKEYSWLEIIKLLSTHQLIVSGRHHINIFCMLAGLPFVSMPSNTWKIEGTLKDMGNEGIVLLKYDDLISTIEHGKTCNFTNLIISRDNVNEAVEKTRNFLSELSYGNYHPV